MSGEGLLPAQPAQVMGARPWPVAVASRAVGGWRVTLIVGGERNDLPIEQARRLATQLLTAADLVEKGWQP